MILKASQRAGGNHLAAHLLNARDNDHVTVHEVRGFISDNLFDAFTEAYAISRGTKCKQYLFSVSLSPPIDADVSIKAFEDAIAKIEERNGLVGQPRAIVFHEKEGRRHAHCVWNRIRASTMTAVNLPHFKLKLRDLSRDLYLENDWKMPRGLMNSEASDPLNFDLSEWQQALRAKTDPKELKALFLECWAASDSKQAFEAFLSERGFVLAQGDRRGFVAVDWRGEIYSLSRWTEKKNKELAGRLGLSTELQTVAVAVEKAAALRSAREDEFRALIEKKKAEFLTRAKAARHALVAKQREERQRMSEAQKSSTAALRAKLQARLPTGIKALWFRLTGQYHKLIASNQSEYREHEKRARIELENLISAQLKQRRTLKAEYEQDALQIKESLNNFAYLKRKDRTMQRR